MIATLIGLVALVGFIWLGIIITNAGREYDDRMDREFNRHIYPKK